MIRRSRSRLILDVAVQAATAAAAAAVCDTRITGEFPARTRSPRVAPTKGRRAAGRLHRGSEIALLLRLCDVDVT